MSLLCVPYNRAISGVQHMEDFRDDLDIPELENNVSAPCTDDVGASAIIVSKTTAHTCTLHTISYRRSYNYTISIMNHNRV